MAVITEIENSEILRLLGVDTAPDAALLRQLGTVRDMAKSALSPRITYRRFDVKNGEIAGLPLPGRDIRAHLDGCFGAFVFAATLGADAERLYLRLSAADMALAVIADAYMSAAVENLCRNFENDLRRTLPAQNYLTGRFSPGSGDLPLSAQKTVCDALNAARLAGITVTPEYLLCPRKSVTAVIGISALERELRSGCAECGFRGKCQFKRKGEHPKWTNS